MIPTTYHKAHITISYETIDRRTESAGYQTLAYSFPPRPQDPEGTKIVLGQPHWQLPLRKSGKSIVNTSLYPADTLICSVYS